VNTSVTNQTKTVPADQCVTGRNGTTDRKDR